VQHKTLGEHALHFRLASRPNFWHRPRNIGLDSRLKLWFPVGLGVTMAKPRSRPIFWPQYRGHVFTYTIVTT